MKTLLMFVLTTFTFLMTNLTTNPMKKLLFILIFILSIKKGFSAGDITPPTVLIMAPEQPVNVSIGYVFYLRALASDNVGVRTIKFYIDSVLYSTNSSLGFNGTFYGCDGYWNTAGYTAGVHTIGMQAIDSAGNVSIIKQCVITLSVTILPASSFPSSFKLKTPPVIDQGGEGSCCSCSVTYLAAFYRKYKLRGDNVFSYFTNIMSPEYTFNRLAPPGDCISGSSLTQTFEFLRDTGSVLWFRLPYDGLSPYFGGNGCDRSISTPFDSYAGVNRTNGYTRIISTDINAIKQALYTGHVVICNAGPDNDCINAGPGFIWDHVSPGGAPHAMAIIGWNDNIGISGAWLMQNSWGIRWANSGFVYETYDNYANRSSYYSYYIND